MFQKVPQLLEIRVVWDGMGGGELGISLRIRGLFTQTPLPSLQLEIREGRGVWLFDPSTKKS